MKTLKEINQEWTELLNSKKEYDSIKFWNSAIKQILENVKPIRKNNILYVLNYEADLDSNIKDILEG